MPTDVTEGFRRVEIARINAPLRGSPADIARAQLEAKHGQVWNTNEVTQDFNVIGFMAPYVAVIRKSDKKKGSLEFSHQPRFFFNFQEDTG